jgi:hypothetical protein
VNLSLLTIEEVEAAAAGPTVGGSTEEEMDCRWRSHSRESQSKEHTGGMREKGCFSAT